MQRLFPKKNLIKYGIPEFIAEAWLLSNFRLADEFLDTREDLNDIVELFFGYERMPYYHLLGSGQLYYKNGMLANKLMLRYDTVDAYGQVRRIVSFMEDADYKSHKEDEEIWWDMSYWVYLDEELGMVQIDENRYREITEDFLNAVEHVVPANTFEEIFGERMKERTGTRKW